MDALRVWGPLAQSHAIYVSEFLHFHPTETLSFMEDTQ